MGSFNHVGNNGPKRYGYVSFALKSFDIVHIDFCKQKTHKQWTSLVGFHSLLQENLDCWNFELALLRVT